jgi:hypothetical protein
MREEMDGQPPSGRQMAQKLTKLKPVLAMANDEVNRFFEEFVREHEWELALHIVCDYLLEPETQAVSMDVIPEIEDLHAVMGILDTCGADLRRKAG